MAVILIMVQLLGFTTFLETGYAQQGYSVSYSPCSEGTSKTVRETLLDSVSNQKLKNAIDQIYRPGAKIGDGGLADAIRHELKTGELVGGKSHITKGIERVRNLENIIRTQNLSKSDLEIATKLLNDLKIALGGK